MEKVIEVDGKPVKFRATAAIPRLYRIKFKRDILLDMQSIQEALEKSQRGEGSIPVFLLEIFENAAYIMARHANPDLPEHSVEEWLDTFETFSIYELFPKIFELWIDNLYSMSDAKKNAGQAPVK